ncbi:MAG: ABC transporter ATP-binding protein [Fibrobacter sp.]|jgi:ATP-binding cassette subfamily B protein|uniref:ABC transporter ATP-binding protein n=1 Tax=Fibrobacter sp. TaxID=35828 RepID=UPI00344E9271|nr:ABC transporter ATP-binding protein [Fibrobacter sp.]
MSVFKRLTPYMQSRKILFPFALLFSALSAIAGMIPFIYVWFIVRELFTATGNISYDMVKHYAIIAVIFSAASVLLYFAALVCSHLVAFRVEGNIRRFTIKKLLMLPLGFFDRNPSGRIRKILDDNATVTHTFIAHELPDLSGTLIIPIAALVLLFVFDWRLGIASIVPIAYAIVTLGTKMNKSKDFMQKYMKSLEDMNTEAVEYVRGIPVVKVFQQTIYSFKNFYNTIEDYHKMVVAYSSSWKFIMCSYTTLINGVALLLVPTAILIITNSGNIAATIIDLMLYILVTPVFSQNIMRSMYLSQALNNASIAINSIESLTNYPNLAEPTNPQQIKNFDIEFKNVDFTYPGTENQVLKGISFSIKEGQTVALVGASGGGKSTIAKLVPRFFDVTGGEILIGGAPIKEIPKEVLMKKTSFVFQNTRLFKKSILENVRYGTPEASIESVNKALDLAQCREIIDRLPDGINTVIGTKGTYLSGGEQQRIVLARAILKNAPIVVLDEATAFADPENEHLIQKALQTLSKGKTVLMIAHRLTSIVNADQILVVQGGEIVERGTHKELVEKGGIFAKMWKDYQQSVTWTIGANAGSNNNGGENV